jgi:hypothetical protein
MKLSSLTGTVASRIALVSILIFAPVCLAQPAKAQGAPIMFPFSMPWDDATPGTATDVSFLNAKPAGNNGRIIVKDGHFAEANTGNRVRFMGVNFTFGQVFPSHENAAKVAAHLAKLGFNIVRIHHHDFNDGPLWDKSAPGHQKFSAEGLDKLDFLIAELKKNGIYVNLNLHVSRSFEPADGFPESVKQLPESFNKRVDRINARMIELQKNFARDYLTRVNPYTKLSYSDDPCIAVVEINNENSVINWNPNDTFYQKLPEPFRGEVVARWNDWLVKKYGTVEALRTAWIADEKPAPPASTATKLDKSRWFLERHQSDATMTPQEIEGQPYPNIEVFNPVATAQPWNVQAQVTPVNFEDGRLYAVSFRAKADKSRGMSITSSIFDGDWHNIGLSSPASVTTEWKEFRFVFRADKPLENNNRVSFVVGGDTGTVWISNLRIEPSEVSQMVSPQYSLKEKNFDLPSGNMQQEKADWMHFLVDTERQYSDEMRRYLRQDLKVKANLVDSQMSFGNTSSFNREADSDFRDEHSYWQHPTFNGQSWSATNWAIQQVSMVDSLSKGISTNDGLTPLALNRVAGKPYSVSEYCVPAPNDFQVEMFPIFASYAALQDWDAIYHFDYGDYGDFDDWRKVPRIQGFFGLAGNPAKESFIATSALLFRTGKIAPLDNVTTLTMGGDVPFRASSIKREWSNANQNHSQNLIDSRLQVVIDDKAQSSQLVRQPAKTSGGANARVVTTPVGAQYIAEGQGALAIAGFIGGQRVQTQWAEFTFPAFGNNYAALILTSAQDPQIATSRRLLLTIGGKAENLDMGWNATRTSVGGNWGHGPAQAEGIPATISLSNARIKHVWALDPTGKRIQEIPVVLQGGKATFAIGPEYRTLHYEIGE